MTQKPRKPNKPRAGRQKAEQANNPPIDFEKRLDRVENYIATIAEPITKRTAPDRTLIERLADGIETNPVSRVVIGLGAFLAVLSVLGVMATAWGVWLQFQSIQEERVARAWQTLAASAHGNSGKGAAIEFLHTRGERLVGINLGGTSLSNGTYINALNLKGAVLERPNINFGELSRVRFQSVTLLWAKANEAFIDGLIVDSRLIWSELVGATFGLNAKSSLSVHNSLLDKVCLASTPMEPISGIA